MLWELTSIFFQEREDAIWDDPKPWKVHYPTPDII